MRVAALFGVAVLAGIAATSACGSDDSSPSAAGAQGGSGGSGGRGGRGGTSPDGSAGTGGSTGGCERFAFVASGTSCPTTGCSSFSCSCPDAFPKSIASCTADGCLVGGDCAAICAADLGDALECTDTHSVGSAGTGGSGGSAGSSGTGGSGGVPQLPCTAADVQRPPTAASQIGNASGVEAEALLTDENGATYVAGTLSYLEAVDLGGGELPAPRQMFLLKLDSQRKHVWSKRFGSEFGIEQVTSFKFAQNGDLLLAGVTGFETDLGGGPKPRANTGQFFIARYDRDGGFVAGHVLPVSNSIPTLSSIVETPSGDYLLIGSFSGTAPFGTATLISAGEQDAFIWRVSAAGSVLDLKQYGRGRNDLIFDAIGAPDGTLFLVGFSYYAVDFGKDPIDLGQDGLSYVAALDASLQPRWQKLIGSGGAYPRRARLDGGSLVVAGDAYGSLYYGDSQTGALPRGNAFVYRIDAVNGSLQRGDVYAMTGSSAQVTALERFADGVAIGGYIHPPTDFGGGPLASSQSLAPFVARFDASGAHLWSTLFCAKSTRGVAAIGAAGTTPIVALQFQEDLELGAFRFAGRGSALLDLAP